MSPSMILGRVVLPASAVVLLIVLAWQSIQSIAARAGATEVVRIEPGMPAGAGAAIAIDRVMAEGRIAAYPGGDVTVGSEVLGTIIEMPAREKAAVRKGELLVHLRDDEVRASLRQAQSQLMEAEIALRLAQARLGLDSLLPMVAIQPAAPESRRDTLAFAEARRDAARAAVDRLEAEAARYRIVAPIDGVVISRLADPGETVTPATPLLTIADLTRLRVEAEVDEFDIPRVAVDATATLSAEGYPDTTWRGRVEEIADAVIPRQTRPEDPGRPADTRVLVVRIALLEKTPLRLGQRVEVQIASLATPEISRPNHEGREEPN